MKKYTESSLFYVSAGTMLLSASLDSPRGVAFSSIAMISAPYLEPVLDLSSEIIDTANSLLEVLSVTIVVLSESFGATIGFVSDTVSDGISYADSVGDFLGLW